MKTKRQTLTQMTVVGVQESPWDSVNKVVRVVVTVTDSDVIVGDAVVTEVSVVRVDVTVPVSPPPVGVLILVTAIV
jgi:hypothetical protein